jgi:hypothetical protein
MAEDPLAGLTDEQKGSIWKTFQTGRKQTRNCFDGVTLTLPGGAVILTLTLDGTAAKVTDATLMAPLAGTQTETCIKAGFVGLPILPFDGSPRMESFGYRPRDHY